MRYKGNYADKCSSINQTYIENLNKLIYEGQGSCLDGVIVLLKSRNFDNHVKKLRKSKFWAILLPSIEVIMMITYLILSFKFMFNNKTLSLFLVRFMQILYVAIWIGMAINFLFFFFRPSPKALYDYLDYLDTILHHAIGRCNDLEEALAYIRKKRKELNEAYRIFPNLFEKLWK